MTDLEDQVRVADFDRWASSRFVSDPARRADLIALYAFEAELLAIPTRVTQPTLAEMRYAWWAEQMDGVFQGAPRKGHPILEALAAAVIARRLERGPLDALIEAHIDRVHGEPHDLNAFYVGPMQQAVRILAGDGHDGYIVNAGRVRGLSQTGRTEEARALRAAANRDLRGLPTAAFPAVAHATLTDPDAAEPFKRIRLAWAALTGRI